MDLHLKDKSVLVTGASAGLGKATAMEYAREKAHVFISSRDEQKLKKAVEEIKMETKNENIYYFRANMRDKEEIEALINKVVTTNGTIDVLINNAGGPPSGPLIEMSDDDWYAAFEQNLLSVVRASRYAIPFMKKQGAGRIINITSSSLKQSIDHLGLSNTMRPGVLGLTKTLAREFAKDQILVNTVGPGNIATERVQQLSEIRAQAQGKKVEDILAETVSNIPLGRLGEPEEFAKAVVFLGSFANTYITGQSLIVDGASIRAL